MFTRGRHVRPQGFIDDCEKYNEAALLGWTVVRIVPHGPQLKWLEEGMRLVERGLARCPMEDRI